MGATGTTSSSCAASWAPTSSDADGVYDPGRPNDRLLLGLKGTMSEFELTALRQRLLDAAVAKARRGELRLPVPIGYLWPHDLGLMMDPDRRVQDAVRTIFRLFDRLGWVARARSCCTCAARA